MLKLSWTKSVCLNQCKRMFFYKYIRGIEPTSFNKSLSFGKLFHRVVEDIYRGESMENVHNMIDNEIAKLDTNSFSQDDFDEIQWQEIVLKSMANGVYSEFYSRDVEAGVKIVEIEEANLMPVFHPKTGRRMKGVKFEFIDDLVILRNNEMWLVEYKTSSRLGQSYFERLLIDGQTNGMLDFLERKYNRPFAGIIFRVIKKPGIRQTKKETTQQFWERLEEEFITKPSEYFIEKEFYKDKNLVEDFRWDLQNSIVDMRHIIKNDLYYKNTAMCSLLNCKFMPLCSMQEGAEVLFKERKNDREDVEEVS